MTSRWIQGALWMGLGLALGRMALLFAMERVAHGLEFDYVATRVAASLPTIAVVSVAITFAGAALAAISARLEGGARTALAGGALAVLALGTAALWSGRLAGDASRVIGLDTGLGLATSAVIGIGAVITAALFVIAAPRLRARPASIALPLVLLVGLPLTAQLAFGGPSDEMIVREVVRDLLAEPPAWRGEGHRIGVLTPSGDYRNDGGDQLSLILPPPGEVRFTVDKEDVPAALAFRVGLDERVVGIERLSGHSIRFEVEIDGKHSFSEDIVIEKIGRRGSEWTTAPEFPMRAGIEVALRTSLLDPNGEAYEPPPSMPPIATGFGGIELVRELRRKRERSSPEAPNIVLIVMDTLRADRLSTYGYERPTSPNLERLAARGLTYDRAYSTSSWTWPSTASILTGLHPQEHGVVNGQSCTLAQSLVTLPEVLQSRGYSTAGWSANLLIVPDKNFDQGFEHFEHAVGTYMKSEVIIPSAIEWIESRAGTRFFLYLQLLDPHSPLVPLPEGRELLAADVPTDYPAFAIEDYRWQLMDNCGHTDDGSIETSRCVDPEDQKAISDLYDACVWSGDYWVGQLLDKLDALNLSDETVVVFTSDHGEELFEHGQLSHGMCLYQPSVNVPLIMAGPGIPSGVRSDHAISNRHLAPSLARVANAGWPTLAQPQNLLDPRQLKNHDVMFSTLEGWWNGRYTQPLLGLLREDHVLHVAPQGSAWGVDLPNADGEHALFNLRYDPEELEDISRKDPDLAQRMRRDLEARAAAYAARRTTTTVEAGSATLEMLRGIGYLDDE